jgi:TonB-linked SusC/RagA family outer membrane protein
MRALALSAVTGILLACPSLLDAQAITGTVRDQATGEPIAAAQVSIEGLDVGVLTQASGTYLLLNVPVGTHTVSVVQLGYRTVTSTVTVAAGQSVVYNVAMSLQALQLEEVVVTGTASGSRVREIGNVVSRLDADIAELQPIVNVSDLLRGRVPGVVIQQGSGAAGSASTVKIRGSSTMRLVNDGPLIYIDGVRVNNRMATGTANFFQGSDVSRIDDIDPAMIESLEVIKGPAAATLYGTEAANGVINIMTKRGRPGAARWSFTTRQGANWFRDPAGRTPTNWGINPDNGQLESFNILDDSSERDLLFRTGRTQYYGIDVSGGTDDFQYFVSGSASQDEGATFNSWARKYDGRINLTAQPTNDLTITANAGIGLTRLSVPDVFPYFDAVFAAVENRGDGDARRGYRIAPPEARYERDEDLRDANRMTAGFTLNHRPYGWFTQRLTFGLDITDQTQSGLNNILTSESADFFNARQASGAKAVIRDAVLYSTFDYGATATRILSETLASSTSVGFQVYTKSVDQLLASGVGFPVGGVSTIGATGERFGSESLLENNTVGVYLQQQIGWRDRLFFIAAVRADDNSAFGENFDLVYYPKASASWVLSEESFWGLDFVNSIRLRAAYGESGQQPDAFDALRSFTPRTAPDGGATVRPDSPGNAELGPERGAEVELGFDASFFNGRVFVDFTYYDQTTKNAIVGRDVAPSEGFTGTQFVNLGRISNRGIELGLGARIIESSRFDWDLNVNLSTNRNRIEELGLDGFLQLGWTTRHAQGYPVGALFAPKVIQAEYDPANPDRILPSSMRCDDGRGQPVLCNEDAWIYQGHPDPDMEGSLSSRISLGDRFTIDALIQGKTGQTKYDLQAWGRYALFQQTELNAFPREFDTNAVAEAQNGATSEFALWVNPASFVRFRELSVSYRMPESWTQHIGTSGGTVSLSARNLGMIWTNWQEWPQHDPEVVVVSNTFSGNREPQAMSAVPPLAALSLTIRLAR